MRVGFARNKCSQAIMEVAEAIEVIELNQSRVTTKVIERRMFRKRTTCIQSFINGEMNTRGKHKEIMSITKEQAALLPFYN